MATTTETRADNSVTYRTDSGSENNRAELFKFEVKSSTETLIAAMHILARDIQSEDGVANAAIFEAAQRLEELYYENIELKEYLDTNVPGDGLY